MRDRIGRTKVEIRKPRRRLDGAGLAIRGEDTPSGETYRRFRELKPDELEDQVQHDRKLEKAGEFPIAARLSG
jgi:hypothetical protein